jgi:hypothetical protein
LPGRSRPFGRDDWEEFDIVIAGDIDHDEKSNASNGSSVRSADQET